MTQVCLKADRDARRIEEAKPQDSVLGASITIEEQLVDDFKQIGPPASLKESHGKLIAVWIQRIALLESFYDQRNVEDPSFNPDVAKLDELATAVSALTEQLGIPECGF